MSKQVIRVACSNDRVTQGKVYELSDDDYIIDDNGKNMRPSFNPDYWKTVTRETKEENKMIIETKTFINNREVNTYSLDDLINIINKQKEMVDRLVAINMNLISPSTVINKLIDKHEANIELLINLLGDAKDEQ